MKPNIFKHRLNTGFDGTFFNLPDTVFPSLSRAAAIADLLEVACESGSIDSFDPGTLQKAAQAIRLEIRDAEALIDAYLDENRTENQTQKQLVNGEDQFVTITNWASYSLDVCGNRYRFIDKATQEILLQFTAASDDEAEEVCTDYLRRRGLQAKDRQERAKKPD
jgi:hypothetical protein